MRHLMSPLDFSVEELETLLNLAGDIEKHPEKYAHACEGKKLATLFYEPSTRTRLSFEAAMMNLGGTVLGFFFCQFFFRIERRKRSGHHSCSILLCKYLCDASSERRRSAGSIYVFPYPGYQRRRWWTSAPDADSYRSSYHPFFKGSPEQSYHWFCGDLKFGRTVHSLIEALVRYTGIKIVLISPEELRLPDYIRDDVLRANNVPFEEVN